MENEFLYRGSKTWCCCLVWWKWSLGLGVKIETVISCRAVSDHSIPSLFGAMFPLPRIIYAMSSDGLLFPFLGKVHSKFQTPLQGTLFSGLVTAIMAAFFNLQQLVNLMAIGTLLAYSIVAICVLILRYSPDFGDDSSSPNRKSDSFGESTGLVSLEPSVSLGDILKGYFSRRTSQPTQTTITIVVINIILLCILSLALAVVFTYLPDEISSSNVAGIAPVVAIVLFMLLILASLCVQPKATQTLPFQMPWVPLLPCLSIFINMYLMVMLDGYTWLRYAVWMAIGLIPYTLWYIWKNRKRGNGKNSKYEVHRTNTVKLNKHIQVIELQRTNSHKIRPELRFASQQSIENAIEDAKTEDLKNRESIQSIYYVQDDNNNNSNFEKTKVERLDEEEIPQIMVHTVETEEDMYEEKIEKSETDTTIEENYKFLYDMKDNNVEDDAKEVISSTKRDSKSSQKLEDSIQKADEAKEQNERINEELPVTSEEGVPTESVKDVEISKESIGGEEDKVTIEELPVDSETVNEEEVSTIGIVETEESVEDDKVEERIIIEELPVETVEEKIVCIGIEPETGECTKITNPEKIERIVPEMIQQSINVEENIPVTTETNEDNNNEVDNNKSNKTIEEEKVDQPDKPGEIKNKTEAEDPKKEEVLRGSFKSRLKFFQNAEVEQKSLNKPVPQRKSKPFERHEPSPIINNEVVLKSPEVKDTALPLPIKNQSQPQDTPKTNKAEVKLPKPEITDVGNPKQAFGPLKNKFQENNKTIPEAPVQEKKKYSSPPIRKEIPQAFMNKNVEPVNKTEETSIAGTINQEPLDNFEKAVPPPPPPPRGINEERYSLSGKPVSRSNSKLADNFVKSVNEKLPPSKLLEDLRMPRKLRPVKLEDKNRPRGEIGTSNEKKTNATIRSKLSNILQAQLSGREAPVRSKPTLESEVDENTEQPTIETPEKYETVRTLSKVAIKKKLELIFAKGGPKRPSFRKSSSFKVKEQQEEKPEKPEEPVVSKAAKKTQEPDADEWWSDSEDVQNHDHPPSAEEQLARSQHLLLERTINAKTKNNRF